MKESWDICGDAPVKVSLVAVQLDAMQEIVEKCSQDNTILIENIPEGIAEEYLRLYLECVTPLVEDDFTLEHKGTMALMVLQGDATG